jgi:hypothetical protein
MMPPMMEWVVDTGSSQYVASRIHSMAPVSAVSMPEQEETSMGGIWVRTARC